MGLPRPEGRPRLFLQALQLQVRLIHVTDLKSTMLLYLRGTVGSGSWVVGLPSVLSTHLPKLGKPCNVLEMMALRTSSSDSIKGTGATNRCCGVFLPQYH